MRLSINNIVKKPLNKISEPIMFSILMAGFMSFTLSGLLGVVNMGFTTDFLKAWGRNFIVAYFAAFFLSTTISPKVRQLTKKIMGQVPQS